VERATKGVTLELSVKFFDGGYCTHPECITMRGGRLTTAKYPSMFMLITHPKYGHILYDTGYSSRFKQETAKFPEKFYALLTPVYAKHEDVAVSKLKEMGIDAKDINHVILSHFHADHIGAAADFPNAKYIYLKDSFEKVRHLGKITGLLNGYLPGLLPKDFLERSTVIDANLRAGKFNSTIERHFENVFDIFGDGSLVAVELPGHAEGQLGLYLRSNDEELFFVADSCWLSQSIRENRKPSLIANIIQSNNKEFAKTLEKLHHIWKESPEITIVPSHCGEFFAKRAENCHWDQRGLNGT